MIGTTTPTKKLDINCYSRIDTIIIRLIYWYFNKKNITVLFINKRYENKPCEKLYISSNGNIGIGV